MGISRTIAGVQPFAELFKGATTTVYKGYERSLDRFVLLKVLRPEFGQDETLVRRFEDEARLIARVQHPNIVSIYSFGKEGDDTYLISEFVEGLTLRDLIADGPLPPEIAVFILAQVSNGLHAAHSRGVFHRDIKPENVLISFEGVVKVADFGMASLEDELSEVRGTLGYMAPEQVLGGPFTRSSDLFSLGATFYEMLAGRPAFPGADASQRFNSIVNADPLPFLEANPRIPEALTHICRKLLQKTPGERYSDAGALAVDLNTFLRAHAPSTGSASLKAYIESPVVYASAERMERLPVPSGDGHRIRVPVPTLSYTVVYDPDRDNIPDGAISKSHLLRSGLAVLVFIVLLFAVIGGISRLEQRDRIAAGGTGADSLSMAAANLGLPADSLLGDSLIAGIEPGEQLPQPGERSSSRRTPAALSQPVRTSASLEIGCSPWCTVFIDGDSVGTTPFVNGPLTLGAGTYSLELRNPDFPVYRATVNLENGEERRFNVVLYDHVGEVNIATTDWAEVLIDSAVRDTTPTRLYLQPGRYRLGLRNPGLGTWETDLEVEAGTTQTLEYNLEQLLSK
jgi:eukaryotic-like serine/threonine-protein kinase